MAATPIEDFNAKFVSARYLVDAGTPQEHSYSFPAAQVLKTGFVQEGYPVSAWLASLPPQSVGPHTVALYLTMSADHWDGFGLDPAGNLLRAGEQTYFDVVVSFEVVPPGQRKP